MWNSRDHVLCTQHLEITYALKKFTEAKTFNGFCCCFGRDHFQGFDSGSVRIKGAKTLYMSVVYSKQLLQATQANIYLT